MKTNFLAQATSNEVLRIDMLEFIDFLRTDIGKRWMEKTYEKRKQHPLDFTLDNSFSLIQRAYRIYFNRKFVGVF